MAYYDNVSALSPKLWYKFNGDTTHYGSLTNALTEIGTGSAITFPSGVVGNACVKFNNGKYYRFGALNSGDLFDDRTFSIELWAKGPATTPTQNSIFEWVNGNQYLIIKHDLTTAGNEKYTFQFDGGTSYPSYDMISSNVARETFHHIVVTFTPSAVKLYIDGVLDQTVTNPNIPNSFILDTAGTSQRQIGVSSQMAVDEFAVYGQELTATQVFNNYDSAYNAGALSAPLTASALLPMPAIAAIRNPNNTASVMTASGLFKEPSWNFTNFPTMLDTYLAGRSFEQWYKFDEIGKIVNYGSGGNAETAWAFNGANIIQPQTGIQGSGALKIKAEEGNTVTLAFGVNAPYSTEITDNEFSIGVWFKGESGFGDKGTRLVVFNNPFGDDSYNLFINDSGFPTWVATGTQTRTVIANAFSVLDNNWHLIQVRASDANNQIAISVDNGTEVTTSATGNHWPQDLGYMELGRTYTSGTNNKYGYISNMWITGYSSIGSTERAAMITAAAVPIQGTAKIIPATARFTNQYQEKIDT